MASDNEPPSAAAKVFSTFELLESILLHVSNPEPKSEELAAPTQPPVAQPRPNGTPIRVEWTSKPTPVKSPCGCTRHDQRARMEKLHLLYRSQRVNTTFKAVIARSKPLRVRMYRESGDDNMQPEAARSPDRHDLLCGRESTINTFIFRFQSLLSLASLQFRISLHMQGRNRDPRMLYLIVSAEGPIENPDKSASWRSMLFTSKPVNCKLHVCARRTWQSPDTFCRRSIELTDDTTLGDVADEAVKAIAMAGELQPLAEEESKG